MSYNTSKVLAVHGISAADFSILSLEKKTDLFYEALKIELPLGLCALENAISRFKNGERDPGKKRLMFSEDPHSKVGGQIIRLLFDIPRQVIEKIHGVAIGGYNCCSPLIAFEDSDLEMSLEEQFQLQSTPDC